MCVECCWFLCVHQVTYRGASYFFSSVHTYNSVYKAVNLILNYITWKSYWMKDSQMKIDKEPEDMTFEMIVLIHSLASAATGFLIFRGIEKEWRRLIQAAAGLFIAIELLYLASVSAVYYDKYQSFEFTLRTASSIVFALCYIASLCLYVKQMRRESEERGWKFEPQSYLYGGGLGISGLDGKTFAGGLGGTDTGKSMGIYETASCFNKLPKYESCVKNTGPGSHIHSTK